MTRPAALPPEVVPFPVADRYLVRPDLTRLGTLPPHVDDPGPPTLVRLDAGAPRALAHALRELAEAPGTVRWIDPDVPADTWGRWASGIAAALAAEGDPRVGAAGDGALCFPWLGVRVEADGALVRGVVDAMVGKGPFVRYVWSLAADDALSHHPRRHPAAPLPPDPRGWWLRLERQTTLGLPPDGAAFFIHVQHQPLPVALATPARRAALAAAVRSMDEASLAYKGLGARRDDLLAWLEAGALG